MPNLEYDDLQREQLFNRVYRFLWICAVAWAAYGLYYGCCGYRWSACVCAAEVVLVTIHLMILGNWRGAVRWVANANMAVACAGLFVEAMISGQAQSSAQWFLVCIGLLGAHQLGMRASVFWAGVAIFLVALIHFVIPDGIFPVLRPWSAFDKGLHHIGLTLIILAISLHAEWTFKTHESMLVSVTKELTENTKLLQLSEAVAGVGHWRWDVQSGEVTSSGQLTRILGMPRMRCSISDFLRQFSPSQAKEFKEALNNVVQNHELLQIDLKVERAGRERFLRCSGLCVHNDLGQVEVVFGTIRDDTDTREVQDQLREKNQALKHMASHDSLTGLANRHRFQKLLDLAMDQARSLSNDMALLLIDMDGFKHVNDSMGHNVGDEVLRQIAKRLSTHIRGSDSAARLGGDEFTIILNQVKSAAEAVLAGKRLRAVLEEPYCVDKKTINLGASIGAALFPQHAGNVEDLLINADIAMYEAKRTGGGVMAFENSMALEPANDELIDDQLGSALKRGEFELFYQPQVCLKTNRIVAVEALLRWFSAGKIISPSDFIPRLEKSGKIVEVGCWVLNEACRQGRAWLDSGYEVQVAVNISPIQFHEDSFVDQVGQALLRSGLPPHLLDVEVTEGLLVQDVSHVAEKLDKIGEMGVSISVDDFGTGYSSLGYLKHFPIDCLKIDRTFVGDIPDNDDGTIAASVTTLAHNLGMQVVGEGVETEVQLEFLKSVDCDRMQGFLFSKPVPAADCFALLQESLSGPFAEKSSEDVFQGHRQ